MAGEGVFGQMRGFVGERVRQASRFRSSGGSYDADRRRYSSEVARWNAGVAQLEAEGARHDQMIDEYNGLVDEYNAVAEAAYSRWWLLPIPAPRRAGRTVRELGSSP